MPKDMRLPYASEKQCVRSSREIEGMSRLESLVRDVSRRVAGCSQVTTMRRKVDFGGLEYHEFDMEQEMAKRTVIKKDWPPQRACRPHC